jgi:D-serine dehydratase
MGKLSDPQRAILGNPPMSGSAARTFAASLDWMFKGFPALDDDVAFDQIRARRWNVLAEDVMLPAAILRESALDHNIRWMQRFCELAGVHICPHAKTTMAPQLVERQLAAGAWGITAATVAQVRVFRRHGISRILLANQLIGRQSIGYILNELERDPEFDFYCLVDSESSVAALEAALDARKLDRKLQVLIEVGRPAGRAGVRTEHAVVSLAERVAGSAHLELRGLEAFEGIVQADVIDGERNVREWLKRLAKAAEICRMMGYFAGRPLLTAGGSSYFDIVADVLSARELRSWFTIVLRSGCYVAHDSEFYDQMVARLLGRSTAALSLGETLRPAIELWAYVLSRPEPGRIVAGLGKRDASFDIALPKPLGWSRPGSAKIRLLGGDHRTVRLDDQHAYLEVPFTSPLKVGDLISFGISHPCTTFDRWPVMYLADDDLNITGAVRTFF